MPNGKTEFLKLHADAAQKIDSDPFLADEDRENLWEAIDAWDEVIAIGQRVIECMLDRPFLGPAVVLDNDEELGTTQDVPSVTRSFASQPLGALPPLTQLEIATYLTEVEQEPDPAKALQRWTARFGELRLRPVPANPKLARVFAFRDSLSPAAPLIDRDFEDLLIKLAIPGAVSADRLMMAYKPDHDDIVHSPTCCDANLWNLGEFVPGGLTAGGIQEVITTPPRCTAFTMPPRRIAA